MIEMEFFTLFFNYLYLIRMRQGDEDKLYWAPSRRGLFDVRLFGFILLPQDRSHFPWRSIWLNKAFLIVAFFAWSVALGKILTMDNLRKQYIIAIDWYCMCKKIGKIVDQFLLHSEIANALWSSIFEFFWVRVVHDLLGDRSLCLLERAIW